MTPEDRMAYGRRKLRTGLVFALVIAAVPFVVAAMMLVSWSALWN